MNKRRVGFVLLVIFIALAMIMAGGVSASEKKRTLRSASLIYNNLRVD